MKTPEEASKEYSGRNEDESSNNAKVYDKYDIEKAFMTGTEFRFNFITEPLSVRMKNLTDEKYAWLNFRYKMSKEVGYEFNLALETDVWYTKKIAELQIMVEKLNDTISKIN